MQAASSGRFEPGSWLDTAAVAAIAVAVAAPALGSPPLLVFDESYYVVDAVQHLDQGVADGFQAHPPLGTWLVAAGLTVVDGPVGWRLSALVAGVLAVALLHRLAARLLPGTLVGRLLAVAAALLLVTDGSWLVMARTGMLDGPLTTLVVAAVAAAVAAAATDGGRRWGWVAAAGAAVGAATAVKWSGALAGPVVAVVLLCIGTATSTPLRSRLRTAGPALLAAATVAVVVYGATWTPWALARGDVPLADCPAEAAPCPETGGVGGLVDVHRSLLRYHQQLRPVDVGETPPAVWPLMQRAFGFFRPGCNVISDPVVGTGDVEPVCDGPLGPDEDVIRYLGNPVVWIGFLAVLPLVSWGARRGDPVALVALAGWGLQWLPWLATPRTAFIWSMAPAIPFAALGLVAVARRLPRGDVVRPVLAGAVGAGIGLVVDVVLPAPVGAAVVGWALAPALVAGRTGDDPPPSAGRNDARSVVVAAVLVLVAGVAAVVMRPVWVVDPDADVTPPQAQERRAAD